MLVGYQFDRSKVTALADSSFISFLTGDKSFVVPNRGDNMAVTTSGLSCNVATGQALIQGRLVEIITPENVPIPANSNGFLVIHVDLSQVNTSIGTPGTADYQVINNQVKAMFINQLIEEDLNNGGVDFTFNLGTVSSTSSNVTFTKNSPAWITNQQMLSQGISWGG